MHSNLDYVFVLLTINCYTFRYKSIYVQDNLKFIIISLATAMELVCSQILQCANLDQ